MALRVGNREPGVGPEALTLSLWQALGACTTTLSPLQCVQEPHF